MMNKTGNEYDVVNDHNWMTLLLLPIILFGVVGNILVCMAVTMEKRLQSVTNYFLLSLAITDLLVCIVVWPFSILHEFMGKYGCDTSYSPVCNFKISACDNFLQTTKMFLFAANRI